MVIPRPIAWISSISRDGTGNIAPHSFFNAVSCHPPIVMFASTHRAEDSGRPSKDTLNNVLATQEFVVNLVSRDLVDAMMATARDLPAQDDEFEVAGLRKEACLRVGAPRIAQSRAALECRLIKAERMGDATVVYGDVVYAHLDPSIMRDGAIAPDLVDPVARLGGSLYATLGEVFSRRRE
ncbi:MAG: flavin reductase family protein [Salinarimonadaceae bacterium]|nr:MAG: flavin reductase family protein [Salinarimonadaceae bacterium]